MPLKYYCNCDCNGDCNCVIVRVGLLLISHFDVNDCAAMCCYDFVLFICFVTCFGHGKRVIEIS